MYWPEVGGHGQAGSVAPSEAFLLSKKFLLRTSIREMGRTWVFMKVLHFVMESTQVPYIIHHNLKRAPVPDNIDKANKFSFNTEIAQCPSSVRFKAGFSWSPSLLQERGVHLEIKYSSGIHQEFSW